MPGAVATALRRRSGRWLRRLPLPLLVLLLRLLLSQCGPAPAAAADPGCLPGAEIGVSVWAGDNKCSGRFPAGTGQIFVVVCPWALTQLKRYTVNLLIYPKQSGLMEQTSAASYIGRNMFGPITYKDFGTQYGQGISATYDEPPTSQLFSLSFHYDTFCEPGMPGFPGSCPNCPFGGRMRVLFTDGLAGEPSVSHASSGCHLQPAQLSAPAPLAPCAVHERVQLSASLPIPAAYTQQLELAGAVELQLYVLPERTPPTTEEDCWTAAAAAEGEGGLVPDTAAGAAAACGGPPLLVGALPVVLPAATAPRCS